MVVTACMPSLAGGDLGLSPSIQDWLLQQAQAQQLAQAQAQNGVGQDAPSATPPGFTGYNPPTPPTAPRRALCSHRHRASPRQP